MRELERVAGLSAGQAKQLLMRELEDELRHESARVIRQVEEETKHDAERRARSILSTVMQRVAGGHAIETTVSVVELRSDELKGRIIGREGRNIRTLETLTGIDFIIDDTPGAVLLSGFDGVRREIARLTLEKLLSDGRIHPARIEEAYGQAQSEIDQYVVEVGEKAVYEANVGTLHPELTRLLGRLHYRTSYGQNVLAHSVECARLASLLAAELGASPKTAARAALLHDIGKAVSHEVEGPHALVGGELARRYEETEAVAHAMESHHNEVEPQTVEAVIVQIVDSLSGARPGRARRVAGAVRDPAARPRSRGHAPRGRREGLRHARGPRDPRDRRARQARRRRRCAALPPDRPRRGARAGVPGPDQDHGHPREPGDGLRQVRRVPARVSDEPAGPPEQVFERVAPIDLRHDLQGLGPVARRHRHARPDRRLGSRRGLAHRPAGRRLVGDRGARRLQPAAPLRLHGDLRQPVEHRDLRRRGHVVVRAFGDGRTEVEWTYAFAPRPGAGLLVELGLARLWRRYADQILAEVARVPA